MGGKAADDGRSVDVSEFLNEARFSPYQKLLLCLCFLIVFMDGFDVQVMAVAAPFVDREMHISASIMGTIFAAGTLGAVVASFAIAPIADLFGRRVLIISALITAGVLNLCYGLAEGVGHLVGLRLLSGFFLAVAATATYSYAAEIAPKRAAATAVIVSSSGYALGVAATGFTAGLLIPQFGWRSMFYLSGAVTIAMALVLLAVLPESVRFLALRAERHGARIRQFLNRVDPARAFDDGAVFHISEERKPGLSFKNLLAEGRALPSFGIWATIFLVNFVIYIFMQWLPSLVTNAGGGAAAAGGTVGWFKVGGVIGALLCAVYIDRRRNPYPVLIGCLLASCFLLLGMQQVSMTVGIFMVLVFLVGMGLSGPQYSTNGLMGRLYPTYVRTGGMATYTGIGRLGSMSGPFIVGFLIQAGWTNTDLLKAMLVPIGLAVLVVSALAFREWRLAK